MFDGKEPKDFKVKKDNFKTIVFSKKLPSCRTQPRDRNRYFEALIERFEQ